MRSSLCQRHLVSIHAPLTGSDVNGYIDTAAEAVSIHAPLTGSDWASKQNGLFCSSFNPRSPYGERRQKYTKADMHFCKKILFISHFAEKQYVGFS